MNFNFRKVSAVLASAVMIGSSLGLAAAANYPAPFVQNGNSNVAVVYGSNANVDLVAVTGLVTDLQSRLSTTSTTSSSGVSITGESTPLFTGSSKIYANNTLSSVKTVFTKADLPTVLADGSFSGDVSATYTQSITLGGTAQMMFTKQPTSSDDANFGPAFSTSSSNYIYNASVIFNKAVNFTSSLSKGKKITLFGQSYTVSPDTSTTSLVLLKSAQTVDLDSTSNPSAKVTVNGATYQIDLVTATTTTATLRITDSTGSAETDKLTAIDSGGTSQTIKGLTVAVNTADSNTPLNKVSAEVIVGAQKVTFTDGSAVQIGDSNTVIVGTTANITGGVNAATQLRLSAAAPDADHDGLKSGQSFISPVFGTFKLDYPGTNAEVNSTGRETISYKNAGDDKMQVTFTDYMGTTTTQQFAKNQTQKLYLQYDDNGDNISVQEMELLPINAEVVVGNENTGYLLKLLSITNQSGTSFSSDSVAFQDQIHKDSSGNPVSYNVVITSKGQGTLTVGGKSYTVYYIGNVSNPSGVGTYAQIDSGDSAGNNMILYPTIQTSLGAKLAFYTPANVSFVSWNNKSNMLAGFVLPNGNGFTTITVTNNTGVGDVWNISGSSGGYQTVGLNATNAAGGSNSVTETVGTIVYNFTNGGINRTIVYIMNPDTSASSPNLGAIINPATYMIEGKDNNNNYNAIITLLSPGATSTTGIGIADFAREWSSDLATSASISGGPSTAFGEQTRASNSNIKDEADVWGSIASRDATSSVHPIGTISYPGSQIYGQLYFSSIASNVTSTGSTGTTTTATGVNLGSVIVTDAQVSSVQDKNLIVVGGSCINTVAAKLLGSTSPLCGPDFQTKTGVGSGSFLIQSFGDAYTTGKIALLVAGYEAGDTQNAATYLRTQAPDTSAGKKWIGTSATSATLQTTTA